MAPSRRRLAWLWAWIPITLLVMAMTGFAHGGAWDDAARVAIRMVIVAATLGVFVYRFCERHPWPQPFRLGFLGVHGAASFAYAALFVVLNATLESVLRHRVVLWLDPTPAAYVVFGVWVYVFVALLSYASLATARAAALDAQVAKAQLAVLQGQLHPHFLFNALHTVVQLIESDPKEAVRAAEKLAAALREAIDERRPQRTLHQELAFVRRYLELESLRFGSRLRVVDSVSDALEDAVVPTFSLQTLVENAVRHGAAASIAPTTVTLAAHQDADNLCVVVSDDGAGDTNRQARDHTTGGLSRLREQLRVLYGDGARLELGDGVGRGFVATLIIPLAAMQGPE